MSMGFRYQHGIGVPESCEKAMKYYEYAANHAVKQIEKRGFSVHGDRTKLSEIDVSSKREADETVSRSISPLPQILYETLIYAFVRFISFIISELFVFS